MEDTASICDDTEALLHLSISEKTVLDVFFK